MKTFENSEIVEAVALDWDGTVVDSVPYKLAQNQELAKKFGREMTIDEVRRIWNSSSGFVQLMQNLCGTDDMASIMSAVEEDYNKPEFAKRPFEFTVSSLERSRAAKHGSALITNATRDILNLDAQSLQLTPLSDHIDFIQTIDDWEYKKPDPRVFDKLLGKLGIMNMSIVYIGDELKDADAAMAAGTQFIGVETGMATREEFESKGILSVPTLPDALDLLKL